jgi:hypothetical protein
MYSAGSGSPPAWGAPPAPGPTLPANSEDYATGAPNGGYIMYSAGSGSPPYWGPPPGSVTPPAWETFPFCIGKSYVATGPITLITAFWAPSTRSISVMRIFVGPLAATNYEVAIYDATGTSLGKSATPVHVTSAGFQLLDCPLDAIVSLTALELYYAAISLSDANARCLQSADTDTFSRANLQIAASTPPASFDPATVASYSLALWARFSN